MRRKVCLILMVVSILGVIAIPVFMTIVTAIGGEESIGGISSFSRYVIGLVGIFFFWIIMLLIGATYMDYEGSGTPLGISMNAIFHLFIISYIVFLVLYSKYHAKYRAAKQDKSNANIEKGETNEKSVYVH